MLDPGLSTKRIQYSDVRRLDIAYSRLRLGRNGLKYIIFIIVGQIRAVHIAEMNWKPQGISYWNALNTSSRESN